MYLSNVGVSIAEERTKQSVARSITAPIPTIGFKMNYFLTPRLVFKLSGDAFALKYKRYDGHLFSGRAGLEYRLTPHFALGAAYNILDVNGAVLTTDKAATLRAGWDYNGAITYLKVLF